MKNIWICILLMICCVNPAKSGNYHLPKGGSLTFSKTDFINIPIYDWPRTLLSYRVNFGDDGISESDLCLKDNQSGKYVPLQLSDIQTADGKLISANVNFFAELHSGGKFSFTLSALENRKAPSTDKVTLSKNAHSWFVASQSLKVELPASQIINSTIAPAPILSVSDIQRTIGGHNRLVSANKQISHIETKVVESGDLFVECAVHYLFADGASYLVKVKMIQGYPFVIMDEQMDKITRQDNIHVDMGWDDFSPTRRYAVWDRQKDISPKDGHLISQPIYVNYCQEDPHWTGMGWIEHPEQEMLYRLLSYGGNSTREQVPVMTFWETGKNNNELGVFVYDHNRWNDEKYGIWQPTTDLSVYFRYDNGKLYFNYPLSSGTRSTAISFFDVSSKAKEVEAFNKHIDEIAEDGGKDHSAEMGFRYTMMMHRQYSLFNLNRVKEWVLSYPEGAKQPTNIFAPIQKMPDAETAYKEITTSPLSYYMTGLNGFPGVHSIQHRMVTHDYIQYYLTYCREWTRKQLETVNALFLLSAYVNSSEAMNLLRTGLAGTPNMASDGWSMPGLMSYLYPLHPMAKEWGDFFEKEIRLNGLFYTRPDVAKYESKGGRWAESMAVYQWAYLRPTTATNTALQLHDGKNRFANDYMASRGRWMVDMTTAPVYCNRVTDNQLALQRCYPPHGAHGGGRIVPNYGYIYQLGDWMKYYNPLLAEKLYWAGVPGGNLEQKSTQTDWLKVHAGLYDTNNKGTNPHLQSCKYTGHGIVLRAGVDTPEELSIHLVQVDKGPNYRWGNQGEGNAGGLYFYAHGKIYTGYENESSGDHVQDNLDNVCNFGVMKNGAYRNIGMNELVKPLNDLGAVQMAELTSREKDTFSWSEYLSRSVMLVGTDYLLLYDETGTNWRAFNRFSWFTSKQDDYPLIIFANNKLARKDHWSISETGTSRGFYRDDEGSLLTFISHKKDSIRITNGVLRNPALLNGKSVYELVAKDKKSADGILNIETGNSKDIAFRSSDTIKYVTGNEQFVGTAGVIRRMKNGNTVLALMKGTKIAAEGISISILSKSETAIALTKCKTGECRGKFRGDGKTPVLFGGFNRYQLFIDGLPCPDWKAGIVLSSGLHDIEFAEHVTPMPTKIIDTEYTKNGTSVTLQFPKGVQYARIEVSDDNGTTWKKAGIANTEKYLLPKQPVGKIHIRAISLKGKKEADIAHEYPIYTTNDKPHYPEGLETQIRLNQVSLHWGQVLGAQKYILYRRKIGTHDFTKIYEGKDRTYIDRNLQGVVPAFDLPGKQDNQTADYTRVTIYEYAVSCMDGNGEGAISPTVDTDPGSYLNWNPKTPLKFKRRTAFWSQPYVLPEMEPEMYYPE